MATIQDIFDWLNQGAQGDIPGTGGSEPNAPQASQPSQPQVTPASATSSPGQDTGAQEAAARRRAYQAGQKAGQGLFGKPQQQAAQQKPSTITVDPDTTSNLDFTGLGNLLSRYHQIATPEDAYENNVPPSLMLNYQMLIQSGLPPSVAATILTQPSTAEGEGGDKGSGWGWAYPYAGENQEAMATLGGQPRDAELDRLLDTAQQEQAINPPRGEGETLPDIPNTSDYLRLPSGQYVPMPGATSGVGPMDLLNQYSSQGNPQSFWWNPEPGTFWGNQASGGG